jgi:nitric oxide reductase subunit B
MRNVMTEAALPLSNDDDGPLSPWWLRTVGIVMALGFAGLIGITLIAYRNAPPIPTQVLDPSGALLFSSDDVGEGQAVFLKYGLMANGSIWGHGAYLGPDYSAEALHRMGEVTAQTIAQAQHRHPLASLTQSQQAAVRAEAAIELKANRYNAATGALQFTAAQAVAYRNLIEHWTDYFHDPARNGGLEADLITDRTELRQFTAFVTWAAWASVAVRRGEDYSYTNNFPYRSERRQPSNPRCPVLERN